MKLNEMFAPEPKDRVLHQKLSDYGITKYTLHDNGEITVRQDVKAHSRSDETVLQPFNIITVNGDMFLSFFKNIKDLTNCPEWVLGHFEVWSCKKLVNFKGIPAKIGGTFITSNCDNLTSLEELSKSEILGNITIRGLNKLKNLNGLENHSGSKKSITIDSCLELTSLKGLPDTVYNLFLKDLESLTSLESLPKNVQIIELDNVPVKDLLRVFKVKGLKLLLFKIDHKIMPEENSRKITEIINKYLPTGDIIECQEELIEAGFKEYARLK